MKTELDYLEQGSGAALAEPLPSTGHRVDLARVSLNYPANLAKTDRCPPQHQEYSQQPEQG